MNKRLLVGTFAAAAAFLPLEVSAKPAETCRVTAKSADFFVSSTEKTIKLKKGTLLSWTINELHQGLIVVKAKISRKWVRGEILLEKTSCM